MNKICTSLEQSQKLIELGIDINTADMMWEYNPDKETYWDKPTIIPIDSYIFVNDIPAWSLAALLEMLHYEVVDEEGTSRFFELDRGYMDKYQISYTGADENIEGDYYDNLVDACYELILKLHEQKIL